MLGSHAVALIEESLVAMGVMVTRNALPGLGATLDPKLVVNSEALKERPHARYWVRQCWEAGEPAVSAWLSIGNSYSAEIVG